MLARAHRLRRPSDFRRVYQGGRTLVGSAVIMRYRPNTAGRVRVGIVVSSTVSKKATERNRVRRRLREAMRALIREASGQLDLVVIARSRALAASFADLANECSRLMHQLRKPARFRNQP